MLSTNRREQNRIVLDIGGEGRHPEAWNLNSSHVKTIGQDRGMPIPHHIPGRADNIPLSDGSVDRIFVERTPLSVAALEEIARVIAPNGNIILRHVRPPTGDPHALAIRILPGRSNQHIIRLDDQLVQETDFRLTDRNESLGRMYAPNYFR